MTEKELLDLEIEANAYVDKIRQAAVAAIPILVKLKRAQFSNKDIPLLKMILGTDDPDGQVTQAVRNILLNSMRGIL